MIRLADKHFHRSQPANPNLKQSWKYVSTKHFLVILLRFLCEFSVKLIDSDTYPDPIHETDLGGLSELDPYCFLRSK